MTDLRDELLSELFFAARETDGFFYPVPDGRGKAVRPPGLPAVQREKVRRSAPDPPAAGRQDERAFRRTIGRFRSARVSAGRRRNRLNEPRKQTADSWDFCIETSCLLSGAGCDG